MKAIVLLPHPHYAASARTFDNVELKRQAILAREVFKSLRPAPDKPIGPVGRSPTLCELMWLGYTLAIWRYSNILAYELADRGMRLPFVPEPLPYHYAKAVSDPPWFGDERVHFSHQALLLRKNKDFYETHGHFGVSGDFPTEYSHPPSIVYASQRRDRTCTIDFDRLFY